jgi:hypothetical protein
MQALNRSAAVPGSRGPHPNNRDKTLCCDRLRLVIEQGQTKMKNRRIWAAVLAAAAIAGTSMAAAGNFSSSAHSDFFSPGRHQFYVWCGGAGDHNAVESGRDAEDAQLRLYQASKAAGHASCWPVWQGRVNG